MLYGMKTMFATFCFLTFWSGASAQWEKIYESENNYFEHLDVDFVSNDFGCTIGYDSNLGSGFIMRTEDGGLTWDTLYIDDSFLRSICFASADTAFIAFIKSSQLGVLRSIDAGVSWQLMQDSLALFNPSELSIRAFDSNRIIIGAANISIISTDGGLNWNVITNNPNDGERGIDVLDSIYAGTSSGFLVYSYDHATTFDFEYILDNASSSEIDLYGDKFILSGTGQDGGNEQFPFFNYAKLGVGNILSLEHTILQFPFIRTFTDVEFASELIVYATGWPLQNPNGHFMKSVDGGHHWFTQNTMEDEPFPYSRFDNLSCVNDTVCYAAFGGIIYKTTNGGGFLIDPVQEVSLSVKEIKDDVNFSIAPNPSSGAITIRSEKEKLLKVGVYDLQGKEVYSSFPQDFGATIDLQTHGKGMYIIQVMAGDQIRTAKVVVE